VAKKWEGKGLKILQAMDEQYTGFAPAKDQEYDIARKLVKSLEKIHN